MRQLLRQSRIRFNLIGICSSGSETVFYSIVVPVYNSATVLPELYRRLIAVMESLGERFELLVVDDDSADGSWAALEAITRGDPRVSAIGLAQNVGFLQTSGLRRFSTEFVRP